MQNDSVHKNMRDCGFLVTRIITYKSKIVDSAFIRENMGQRKPVFSHILRIDSYGKREKHDFDMELRTRYYDKEYGALRAFRLSPGFETSESWF